MAISKNVIGHFFFSFYSLFLICVHYYRFSVYNVEFSLIKLKQINKKRTQRERNSLRVHDYELKIV